MANRQGTSGLERVVAEIVATTDARAAKGGSLQRVAQDFRSIALRDYERHVTGHFSGPEMRKLLAALTIRLPALNRDVPRVTELQHFATISSRLGAQFKASSFSDARGRELRGFYVGKGYSVRRPLICVNTAHHAVAVATAFWHEVGHHLTTRMIEKRRQPATSFFSTDYQAHLTDPLELIADMIVVLSAYPKALAERLFATFLQRGEAPDVDDIVSRARTHLRSVSGFHFDHQFSATENLHYLAGMIHYAKLRWALLTEYQV